MRMDGLLTELLAADLIEKLGGDDERLAKIERAAKAVSQQFVAHPPDLIRAILAGLDPDVPATDPAMAQAERALLAEWKSMRSVYTSPAVGLIRAILLEACSQAGEGNRAAILWLTAADALPWVRLGKAESAMRRMLQMLAARAEEAALAVPSMPTSSSEGEAAIEVEAPAEITETTPRTVDRQELLLRVAAAAGPNYRNNKKITNANPSWPSAQYANPDWSWDFADRMQALLADELDALAIENTRLDAATQQLQASQAAFAKTLNNALATQKRWVQDALEASKARLEAEQLRLGALWWAEALYSRSLRCSYRELHPALAAVVMAIDLLDQVNKPTPASVGYLLAEAVHRLPDAEYGIKHALPELLGTLRETRGRLPTGWMDKLSPPPTEGRLSMRDLVILALKDQGDIAGAMGRAGLTGEAALSLPELARALFRQEQAVQLAGGAR